MEDNPKWQHHYTRTVRVRRISPSTRVASQYRQELAALCIARGAALELSTLTALMTVKSRYLSDVWQKKATLACSLLHQMEALYVSLSCKEWFDISVTRRPSKRLMSSGQTCSKRCTNWNCPETH